MNDKSFWQNIPWREQEISSFDLDDLPCRLEGNSLALMLQKIWQISIDDAIVSFRIPHPRHDVFLQDIGYKRGLLPESFIQLDPRHSVTGLATQLGVRFEMLESSVMLDPHWQQALDEQKVSTDEIQLIAKQAANVIEWIEIKLQIKKSPWQKQDLNPGVLDSAMRQQLLDQIEACKNRGDEKGAEVIQNFLNQQLGNG